MPDDEFAPCQLVDNGDGTFSLILTEFDATADTFGEFDNDGGGYGWHGVADALIRLRAPKLKRKVKFDPEAGMFAANSDSKDALRELAGLIRSAHADREVLREALRTADPELLD